MSKLSQIQFIFYFILAALLVNCRENQPVTCDLNSQLVNWNAITKNSIDFGQFDLDSLDRSSFTKFATPYLKDICFDPDHPIVIIEAYFEGEIATSQTFILWNNSSDSCIAFGARRGIWELGNRLEINNELTEKFLHLFHDAESSQKYEMRNAGYLIITVVDKNDMKLRGIKNGFSGENYLIFKELEQQVWKRRSRE